MTRLLVLTNMYPPHSYGGSELSCRDVMERLVRRGHEVSVLTTTMRVAGVEDPPGEARLGVWRELEFYWRDHELLTPPLAATLSIERANQAALGAALERARPDVVSVWNMGAMSLGLLATVRRRDLPAVFAVCDDWLDYGPRLDRWTERFAGHRRVGAVVRSLTGLPTGPPHDLGKAGAFCFVSELTRRRATENTPWSYPISTVVYSGIDRTDFPEPDGPSDARPWNWRLLYVGRLDLRKGVETVLRALPLLPPEATVEVLGAGDASARTRLEQVAAQLGVSERVSFGVVERSALADRYRQADVFVFPSMWDEPFGLVPVEAMACDTPVVATRRGGSAEFLAEEVNCLTFLAGDERGLAAAVRRLADDPALRRRLVEGGRTTAADLTVDRLADVFEEWHVAAAERFARGVPADRPVPGPRAASPTVGADRHGDAAEEALERHRAQVDVVLPTGDTAAIKRLYVELGDLLDESVGDDPSAAPLLSFPETTGAVTDLLDGAGSPVLDAGCGPRPAAAMTLLARGQTVIALDIGLGTVRVARAVAAHDGIALPGVVGDVEALPFRAGSFAAVNCDDTIEHLPDVAAGIGELARVLRPGGAAVIATPNRISAQVLWRRTRDLMGGRRRPSSHYYATSSHLREYSWPELERLVRPSLRVRRRATAEWGGRGWRHLIANPLTRRWPLRHFSRMIVVELELAGSEHEPPGARRPEKERRGGHRVDEELRR